MFGYITARNWHRQLYDRSPEPGARYQRMMELLQQNRGRAAAWAFILTLALCVLVLGLWVDIPVDSAVGGTDTGVAILAKRVDTPAALTPANGDYTWLQVDANGRIHIVPEVKPGPATSGGCSSYSKLSAGTSADEVSVKATPGQIYGIRVSNTNASARYLKIYNSATAPTLGAGTPVRRIKVAGNSERDIVFPVGLEMTTGIAFALTTGAADSDANRVAANEIIVELEYK